MVRLGTFCNECCFYQKDSKTCYRGYLDTFKNRNAEIQWEEDGPKIDRVCPSRRTIEWSDGKNLIQCDKLVNEELYIKGSIILICNDINNLSKTLESLDNIDKIENFNIIVAHEDSIQLNDVAKLCNEKISNTTFSCIKNYEQDVKYILFESFRKSAKNGYVFILDCDKDFDRQMFKKINNLVNHDMYRLLHVNGVDNTIHQQVTMSGIYKWLKGDILYSISDKINEIADQQKTDPQIMTWDEINEIYNY